MPDAAVGPSGLHSLKVTRACELIDEAATAFDTMAMEWHLAQALQLRERL